MKPRQAAAVALTLTVACLEPGPRPACYPSEPLEESRLEQVMPPSRRADYVTLSNFRDRNQPEPLPPEGFYRLDSSHSLEGLEELLAASRNDETGFDAQFYLRDSGEFVVALPGVLEWSDFFNYVNLVQGGVPAQAYDLLELAELAEQFAERHDLQEPVYVGHSLGGVLAQLSPRGVNVAGSGALKARQQLVEAGAYEELPEVADWVLNVGLTSDPIYSWVGPDSAHVAGQAGGIFYLASPGGEALGGHTAWEELTNSQEVMAQNDQTCAHREAWRSLL